MGEAVGQAGEGDHGGGRQEETKGNEGNPVRPQPSSLHGDRCGRGQKVSRFLQQQQFRAVSVDHYEHSCRLLSRQKCGESDRSGYSSNDIFGEGKGGGNTKLVREIVISIIMIDDYRFYIKFTCKINI